MADSRNLVLQLLITAKDEASDAFGKVFQFLDNKASATATAIRAAFTGLFGGGLDGAIEFEAQLSKVQAKGGLTKETMTELKQVAIDLGAKFGVSGTEAAQGMESLAAAGLDAEQIIATLPSVMALAKVEAISMDDASAKLANSLTAVGLGFDQAGRMADVLAKAALESTTSASAVAEALSTAGGIATTSGLSFEQTAAALTALAKGGIEGGAAGTSLSAILTQLINPSSTASKALNELGISSRDLGTVIGELKGKGDAANGAILAFGETAGPGLRTLITQGQSGLNDLTAAMQSAGGSAQATADTMSGNLKGAMGALTAAWDSVKTALFDPVLEPLTKAANELSTSLNTNLKDGALKPLQEAIKSFAENGIIAIREFLTSFDFSQVGPAISQFATDAKTSFDGIANAGKTAADTVVLVWNGVEIAVKAVAIVIAGFSATIVTSVASISGALNAVGVVSDDLNTRVQSMAVSSQNNVTALRDSIVTDGTEMARAWNRLTAETDKTAEANRRIKAALPTKEIQEITYSLKDYEQFAKSANAASEQARQEFEAGKISGAAYAVAIQDAAEANTAFERATTAAAAAAESAKGKTADHAKELAGQIGQLETGVVQSKKYADAVEGVVNAETAGIKAAISLAQAKGDTAAVQRLTIELTQKEADGAIRIAQAKQAEQEAESAVAQKKLELAQIQRSKNEITAEELALAELVAQKEVAEATAAGVNTQAQIQLAESLRLVNAAKAGMTSETQKSTEATSQNIQTTEQSAAAAQQLAAANRNSTDILAGLVNVLNSARSEMQGLSDTAGIYFDMMLAHELDMKGFAGAYEETRRQQIRFKEAISETDPELSKLREGLATAEMDVRDLGLAMITSANSFAAYEIAIKKAKAETIAAFNEQAIRALELTRRYEEFAKGGADAVGGITVTMNELNSATRESSSSMNLLDKQRLDQLNSAIEAANDKLREMQQEAQDAQTALAELNAEILAEQGNTAAADKLKLQISQTSALTELERKLAEARGIGNKELIAIYQQQINKTNELYALKNRNLEAEIAGNDKTTKTNQAAITQAGELATALERSASAAKTLNSVPLDGLLGNLNQVGESVNRLRSAL